MCVFYAPSNYLIRGTWKADSAWSFGWKVVQNVETKRRENRRNSLELTSCIMWGLRKQTSVQQVLTLLHIYTTSGRIREVQLRNSVHTNFWSSIFPLSLPMQFRKHSLKACEALGTFPPQIVIAKTNLAGFCLVCKVPIWRHYLWELITQDKEQCLD